METTESTTTDRLAWLGAGAGAGAIASLALLRAPTPPTIFLFVSKRADGTLFLDAAQKTLNASGLGPCTLVWSLKRLPAAFTFDLADAVRFADGQGAEQVFTKPAFWLSSDNRQVYVNNFNTKDAQLFEYDLTVHQAGTATPIVVDPRVKNGPGSSFHGWWRRMF